MKWTEVRITTASQGAEPICAVLEDIGVTGVIIDDPYETRLELERNPLAWDYADDELLSAEPGAAAITFYVSPEDGGILPKIRAELAILASNAPDVYSGGLTLSTETKDDEQWLDNWKNFYKPFRVGNRVVIKPVWEPLTPDMATESDIIFTIDPGHVFGTGLHQSTRLCLAAIEGYIKGGETLFDIGCGSGILSSAALLLGADKAVSVDIDPACAENAAFNARLNGVEARCSTFTGNLLTDSNFAEKMQNEVGQADIVCANIIADVIIALAPIVPPFLKDGGVFVASGIIRAREEETAAALTANGFTIEKITREDEWVCIAASLSRRA